MKQEIQYRLYAIAIASLPVALLIQALERQDLAAAMMLSHEALVQYIKDNAINSFVGSYVSSVIFLSIMLALVEWVARLIKRYAPWYSKSEKHHL